MRTGNSVLQNSKCLDANEYEQFLQDKTISLISIITKPKIYFTSNVRQVFKKFAA